MPPAFVAALPPIVLARWLLGSGAKWYGLATCRLRAAPAAGREREPRAQHRLLQPHAARPALGADEGRRFARWPDGAGRRREPVDHLGSGAGRRPCLAGACQRHPHRHRHRAGGRPPAGRAAGAGAAATAPRRGGQPAADAGGCRPLRRLGGQRGRRHHRGALAGVRGGRHAARGGARAAAPGLRARSSRRPSGTG